MDTIKSIIASVKNLGWNYLEDIFTIENLPSTIAQKSAYINIDSGSPMSIGNSNKHNFFVSANTVTIQLIELKSRTNDNTFMTNINNFMAGMLTLSGDIKKIQFMNYNVLQNQLYFIATIYFQITTIKE